MMIETTSIVNRYHIEDPTVNANHVLEIMTKMTGLSHVLLMMRELLFDFGSYVETEVEEERTAPVLRTKRSGRHGRRLRRKQGKRHRPPRRKSSTRASG
jgi:hypothetical protein